MTVIPLSSCGYVGQNDLCVYLPSNPVNGQTFEDSNGNVWVYDSLAKAWYDTKRRNLEVADGTNIGLLSSALKTAIDQLDPTYGGFGFIVDRPYTRPVSGSVRFTSDSLNIDVVSASGNLIDSRCTQSLLSVENDIPEIRLSIKKEFLDNLTFYYPAPRGPRGFTGPMGFDGQHGYSETPRGIPGANGPDIINIRKLAGITYVDINELSEESIVNIDGISGTNPSINITRSSSPLSTNEPASGLIGTPIARDIVYGDILTDGCDLAGLSDYTLTRIGVDPLPLDVNLVRISDDRSEVSNGYSQLLSELINSIIENCELKLVDIENEYMATVKKHIEQIDTIARNNLAALADRLNDCESRLESEDWSLSFKRCPSFSPSSALAISNNIGAASVNDEFDGQDYLINL